MALSQEPCLRLPLALSLSLLLLCPASGRSEPPETEPLRPVPEAEPLRRPPESGVLQLAPETGSPLSSRVEVRDEGTKDGKPFVLLAFRPHPRDPALEQLSVEEARAFVQALDDACMPVTRK